MQLQWIKRAEIRMNTIVSHNQFKPIRLRENLVVIYDNDNYLLLASEQ